MFVVDTNILLHASNTDSSLHSIAWDRLDSYVNGHEKWFLTWSIVYEFIRVATHPRVFDSPLSFTRAAGFIINMLSSQSCEILVETAEHLVVMNDAAKDTHRLAGNLLHDFHIAVIMLEHGVKTIVTQDQDFKAFKWVNVQSLR